jgi:phosphohistidine phosphatase SixA
MVRSRFAWGTSLVLLLLVAGLRGLAGEPTPESFQPITAILVRHAEKASEPKGDPVLSEPGQARVEALLRMVEKANLTAVIASEYQRTQLTVRPVAERFGLEIEVVPAKDPAATAAAILAHPGGRVLVAGHSNTLGPILTALGAPPIPEIPESDYGDLFVVTVSAPGKASVLHLVMP